MIQAYAADDLTALGLSDLIVKASAQPVLDDDVETALMRRAKAGDVAALEELVLANLRVAIDEAIRNRGLGSPQRELVQEGVRTLLEAARQYDPLTHGRFSKYVQLRIRKALRECITAH